MMKVFSRLKLTASFIGYYEQFIYPTKNLYRKLTVKEVAGKFTGTPAGNYISEKDFLKLLEGQKAYIIPESSMEYKGKTLIFNKKDIQILDYSNR